MPRTTKTSTRRRSMLLALGLLGLFVVIACQGPEAPSLPARLQQSIIGGAPDRSHPAVGALTVQGRSFCTGTLIAKRVVLTAAHCIDAALSYVSRSKLHFRIEMPDQTNPQGFRFENFELDSNLLLRHPQWNTDVSKGFDVGIAILIKEAKITPIIPYNATPIDSTWVSKEPLFLGYGLIQSVPTDTSAPYKYGVKIPITQVLKDRFVHQAKGKSVCHGDSGGPALFEFNGQLRVFGINSYVSAPRVPGTTRSSCDQSGTSMRTDTFAPFIRSILLKYGDGASACKVDLDCGVCGACGTKLLCEAKPLPVNTSTCKPCTEDKDCNGGLCKRLKEGMRCVQTCSKDGCCPGGAFCNPDPANLSGSSLCSIAGNTCPPVPCKADTECGPGEKCDLPKGTCTPDLPPRKPKLCHPCKSNADCDGPDHYCVGPQGNGRCTQPCGKSDFCPNGFVCNDLYPGAPKQCVPENGTCSIPCVTDIHCPNSFTCQKGFCGRTGGGIHGDTCDPTPCQTGLSCVNTVNGKVCMTPCGIKPGYGGTSCPSNLQCLGGTRCYRTSGVNLCLGQCRSDNDCAQAGGGTCSQSGNCLCRNNNECATGNSCNLFTYQQGGPIGACIPKDAKIECTNNFECRNFGSGSYCAPKGPGVRSLGDKCDSLNRCTPGLVCVSSEDGPRCFEDCTTTRQCKLGGSCLQYGQSLFVCLCQGNNCPKGRTCQPLLQGYGVCKESNPKGNGTCLASAECPPQHECIQGACKPLDIKPEPTPEPKTEPKTEPITEPTPEPTAPDAGPAEQKTAEKTVERNIAPEQKATEKTADNTPTPPKGCGCNTPPSQQTPNLLLFLLGFLFFFPLLKKRQ